MMMVRSLALVAAFLASAHANSVVVLGGAKHVHAVRGASAFSPAGLAQLAMGSLGVATGEVETVADSIVAVDDASSVKSAVLADVFHPVDAYTQIFVDAADAAVLSAVAAPANADFHAEFELEKGAVDSVPAAIAQELQSSGAAVTKCAGSSEACNSNALAHDDVTQAALDAVLAKYPALQTADLTLAQEIAQTQQLIAALEAKSLPAGRAFFVASFSKGATPAAQTAITETVQTLVDAVDRAYPANGVQLVASSEKTTDADAVVVTSRLLQAQVGSGSGSAASTSTATNASSNATTNATSTVDEAEIAEYQIVLWTSILLAAALAMIIMAMCNMDSHHDSLLYAKFTTTAGRKYD